jgi:hypothetical protein
MIILQFKVKIMNNKNYLILLIELIKYRIINNPYHIINL